MAVTTESVISITSEALERIGELRDAETIPDLHLGIAIVGAGTSGFLYETAFLRAGDVPDGDHVEHHGDLPVVIPDDSVSSLQGAVLDIGGDPGAPGLVLRNPNVPSPAVGGGDIELTGTVEEKVVQLLNEQINPSIAAHGGMASLIKVDESTVYLELGGGCQGCGLAAMTLRQGIERAILDNIPEVTEVSDITDHSAGENPFYT